MSARYIITAALLGAGWFLVLLIPGTTRGWLLGGPGSSFILLVVTAVLIATVFRRYILRAETFGQRLARAFVLSYVGTIVFLVLTVTWIWIEDLLFGGLANLHDSLAILYIGTLIALLYMPVVLPYGLACQYILERAAKD